MLIRLTASLAMPAPGALGLFKELAAHMHHAGLLIGFIFAEEAIEARKAVRVYGAGIAGEMIDGVFAFAIRAELIPRAGRRIPTP